MKDFKSGLINCICAVCSIALLVLLIVFSGISANLFNIIFYTLFGSFVLLYFIFSVLYDWIGNENCKNVFIRFINICKILSIFTALTILNFSTLSSNFKMIFFSIITTITCFWTIFSSIWKKVPSVLSSLIYIFTHISISIFFIIIL